MGCFDLGVWLLSDGGAPSLLLSPHRPHCVLVIKNVRNQNKSRQPLESLFLRMVNGIKNKSAIYIMTNEHPVFRYSVGRILGKVVFAIKPSCLDQMKGVWIQDLGIKCNLKILNQLKLERKNRQEQRENVV